MTFSSWKGFWGALLCELTLRRRCAGGLAWEVLGAGYRAEYVGGCWGRVPEKIWSKVVDMEKGSRGFGRSFQVQYLGRCRQGDAQIEFVDVQEKAQRQG